MEIIEILIETRHSCAALFSLVLYTFIMWHLFVASVGGHVVN